MMIAFGRRTRRYRFLLIAAFTLLLSAQASAQIGIHLGYSGFTAGNWEKILLEKNFDYNSPWGAGYHIGVDYAYKIKDIRIEIAPELNAQFYSVTHEIPDESVKTDLNLLYTGLDFNGHFYLLDLYGDCDCPTFTKKGPWFNQGMYLIATVGAGLMSQKAANTAVDVDQQLVSADYDDKSFAVRLGLGLGLDLHVSKTFTITPTLKYQFSPGMQWEDFSKVGPDRPNLDLTEQEKSGSSRFYAGIRLGFHPPAGRRH